jgi:hypothetical protein
MKNNKESAAIKHTAKEDPAFSNTTNQFTTGRLDMPAALKKELDEAGYSYRFINEVVFRRKNYMHQSGWLPYHVKNKRAMSSIQGIDVDGAFRRGDLILAVRPIDMTVAHRQRNQEQIARQSGKEIQRRKTQEFKQLMRSQGLAEYEDSRVLDGYEANED